MNAPGSFIPQVIYIGKLLAGGLLHRSSAIMLIVKAAEPAVLTRADAEQVLDEWGTPLVPPSPEWIAAEQSPTMVIAANHWATAVKPIETHEKNMPDETLWDRWISEVSLLGYGPKPDDSPDRDKMATHYLALTVPVKPLLPLARKTTPDDVIWASPKLPPCQHWPAAGQRSPIKPIPPQVRKAIDKGMRRHYKAPGAEPVGVGRDVESLWQRVQRTQQAQLSQHQRMADSLRRFGETYGHAPLFVENQTEVWNQRKQH